MLTGRIIKNISDSYTVLSNNNTYICKARGKFRNIDLIPLVGDIVDFDPNDLVITTIHDRINELSRPKISNVDASVIVTSLKKPELSLNLLDKELSSIIINNIEPIICFTKIDLANHEDKELFKLIKRYYESIGIKCFTNKRLRPLIKYLKDKYVVLTGQTGAGKSSLINKINPKLHLETNEISKSLGRGKHTTRHTEFYDVSGIYIADTPGFSSLDLTIYTKEEIRDSFPEFKNRHCTYKNCFHESEEGCEVKALVIKGEILKSRYNNYLSFINNK